MKCPNCGEELILDFDECPACGKELDRSNKKNRRKKRDFGSKIDSKISSATKEIEEKLETGLDEELEKETTLSKESKNLEMSSEIKSRTEQVDDSYLGMVNFDDSEEEILEEIDEKFQNYFNFEFDDSWPNTYLCETLDEFAEKLVEEVQLSSETAKEIKKKIEKKRSGRRAGVALADGFYLNGWQFLERYDIDSIEKIKEKPFVWDEMIATICHEKLGHGIIFTCTTAGKEIRETNLKKVRLAREFDIDSTLTPDWEIANKKWNALFKNMKYLQEGYATWIEDHMGSLLGLDTRNNHRWSKVEKILPKEDYKELKSLIEGEENTKIEDINRIKRMGKENRKSFEKEMGQPPEYVLGYFILRELENSVGPKNIPFVVSIACDVSYNLEDISLSDLEKLLKNPRFNIDARILQLSKLELGKRRDPKKIRKLAKEKLDMMVVSN